MIFKEDSLVERVNDSSNFINSLESLDLGYVEKIYNIFEKINNYKRIFGIIGFINPKKYVNFFETKLELKYKNEHGENESKENKFMRYLTSAILFPGVYYAKNLWEEVQSLDSSDEFFSTLSLVLNTPIIFSVANTVRKSGLSKTKYFDKRKFFRKNIFYSYCAIGCATVVYPIFELTFKSIQEFLLDIFL